MISIAHAASATEVAQGFVDTFNDAVLFPLITLLMAMAFLVFLYGSFEFVRNSANDAAREQGRRHILYGTIGMLVMLSAYALLELAATTVKVGL